MMGCMPLPVMARGTWGTDFAEIPIGDGLQQHGWTRGGANTGPGGTNYDNATYISTTISGGSISDRGIVVDQDNVNDYRHARWTRIPSNISNFEFLALVRVLDLPDAVGGGGFCLVQGDDSNADGHDWVFDSDNFGGSPEHIRVGSFLNGSFEATLAQMGVDITSNRYWVRGRKSGNTLSVKVWEFGSAEPSYASGNTVLNIAGWFGIQTVRDKRFRVDWLDVVPGTNKVAAYPNG